MCSYMNSHMWQQYQPDTHGNVTGLEREVIGSWDFIY
jgi:hypothetical protein